MFNGTRQNNRDTGLSVENAEKIGISALTFLGQQEDQFSRFMTQTGVEVGNLREVASTPGFLAGVLQFVLANQSLLDAFCLEASEQPDTVSSAFFILAGPHAQ